MLTVGLDWFDKIHAFPRAKIAFGNIITTVDQTFELFNAFRTGTVLVSWTNNAGAGLTIPNLPTLPYMMSPLTSMLDPSSTRLNPVKMFIRVTQQGAASFDSTLDFLFAPGGTVVLRVSGQRLSLIMIDNVDGRITETLSFGLDALPKRSGKIQRVSPRKNPRQILDYDFFLEGLERRQLEALFFDSHARIFAVPVWPEQMTLTAAIIGGATNIAQVDSTTNVDLRVGGTAAVYKNSRTFDALNVTAKTSTTITFDTVIQNSYAVGDLVVPTRLAHAEPTIQGVRYPVNVERLRVKFRVIDNDTGIPAGSTASYGTFSGKVLLDDCNFLDADTTPVSFERETMVVDNLTGLRTQTSPWSRDKRGHVKGFLTKTRAGLFAVRQLLLALRGPQISFWIPTFADELVVTQNLSSGSSLMRVENIGYARYIAARQPRASFRITFTDGTFLERTITSAVEVSTTEEDLTLNTTWPSTRTVAEVTRVQFYELVTIDSDDVVIQHDTTVGKARIFFPVKVAFDNI